MVMRDIATAFFIILVAATCFYAYRKIKKSSAHVS
jgi:hypothetical protein